MFRDMLGFVETFWDFETFFRHFEDDLGSCCGHFKRYVMF